MRELTGILTQLDVNDRGNGTPDFHRKGTLC
jgi:hypothetical protein